MARDKRFCGSVRCVSAANGRYSAQPWLAWLALLALLTTFGCASADPRPAPVGVESAAVTVSCSDVPAEFVGVGDGCDCPADGRTSCDPDCSAGNPGGAYCGCQYCYPEEAAPPPTGTSCDFVPHEYIGVHDGCDCPSDGSQSCDPDCAEGNIADDYCGCQFCYSGDPSVPPPADPYAIDLPNRMSPEMVTVLARHALNVGVDAQVRRGPRGLGRIVNTNAQGTTSFGNNSHVGETWSACGVQVGDNAEVGGTVYTPGMVMQGAGTNLSGGVEQVPVLPDSTTHTWTPNLPPRTGGDKTIGGATTLAPGGYGNVSVGTAGVLRLGPGVYYIGDLTVASGGRIKIDDAAGPVTIYVSGGVQFDGTVVDTGNAAYPNAQVLIVVTGGGVVRLGGYFNGTVYAPRSAVSLTKPGQPGYSGSFFGNDVTLSPGVFVYHVAFPWSSVKPDAPTVWGDSKVRLGAWFDYKTNTSHPQETTLSAPTNFTIPPILSVRNGNAGTGTARLKFTLGSAAITTCTYLGSAGVAHPSTPAQRTKGLVYEFQSCSNGNVAGQGVRVDWVSLEVLGGDSSDPTKQVEVALDSGDGCSAYIPPPLHQWEVVDLKTSFNWRTIKALPETDPDGHPALWHGLIYIDHKEQLAALDRLRILWSARPLSATYTEQLRGLCGRVEHATDGTGVVVYAVFPAKLFNLIRAVSIRAVAESIVPPFAFIIPNTPEAEYANTDGSIRYDALASTGFHTWLAERSTLSPSFWSKISKPFKAAAKWIVDSTVAVVGVGATVIHYASDGLDELIDALVPFADDIWETAQQVMAALAFAVEQDVGVHLDVRLKNLDPTFPKDSWLVRTWGPACTAAQVTAKQCAGEQATTGTRPILLPTGTKFRIRQWGFGFLPVMKEKVLGSNGQIDLRALKNRTGRGGDFCVQLEADYGMITTDFIPNEVCDFATNKYGDFEHEVNATLEIAQDDLHAFAQVKDGFDYNTQVLQQQPYAADILTGFAANAMTSILNGSPRAMTLCLDFPSMGSSLVGVFGAFLTAGIGDKLYSKDIWWPDAASSRDSRNARVMTHEYGHFTMCDLLYSQNGPNGLQGLMARMTEGEDSRNDETGVVTEMFADSYALQVAGGTNYVAGVGSLGGMMNYCTSGGLCMDQNYRGANDYRTNDPFHDEIARWVSTTYDAFDRVGSAARQSSTAPSNSDYWANSSTAAGLVYSSSDYLGRDDEPVTLQGRDWRNWVNNWLTHGLVPNIGNVGTALFDTVRANHNWCQACELMAAHHPAANTTIAMVPTATTPTPTRTTAVQLQRKDFCMAHPETFNWLGSPPRTDGRFDLACIACPASQYVNSTTGICTACPAGNIATLHGCTACAAGSVPTANNDCRKCAANQISSGNTCVTCGFGQAADAASNTCVFCEPDVIVDWATTTTCGQNKFVNVGINGVAGDHCPNDAWLEVRNIASGPFGSNYTTFKAANYFSPDIATQATCQASTSSIKVNHRSGTSLITDLSVSGTGAYQGACDGLVCPDPQCALPAVSALTKAQVTADGNTLKILVSALRSGAPIGVGVQLTLTPTSTPSCGPR